VAVNVKDVRTEQAVRELAAVTGESLTTAIRIAIEERLARVRARGLALASNSELDDIIARGRSRRMLDDRTIDEIIGYDSDGLPTR
jgi:antitoxin VapB